MKALSLIAFVGFLAYGAIGMANSATAQFQAHKSKVEMALDAATK